MGLSIKTKLLGSFYLIILMFAGFFYYNFQKDDELAETSQKLVEHPLAVTRATLKSNVGIITMHNLMKDVIFADGKQQLDEVIKLITQEEQKVLAEFHIIQDKILGSEGKILAEHSLAEFINWRPIRAEIIGLVKEGKKEEAIAVTKSTGASYIIELNRNHQLLWEHAKSKGEYFRKTALASAATIRQNHMVALASSILLSLILGISISMSIVRRIKEINSAAFIVAKGDFDHKVKVESNDEIGKLSETFNKMTDNLKLVTASRDELDREIIKRKRFERALSIMSDCDRMIVSAIDEQQVLDEICKIVVETGDYLFSWIGFPEDDEKKSVTPVASYRFEEGYLESLKVAWADNEYGQGPTGKAIRTGKPSIMQDIHNNPSFKPWRENAEKRQFASSISLPFTINENLHWVLNIYSRELDAFNRDEVKLLTEMVNDLSFGINSLRAGIAKNKLEEELHNYEYIVSSSTDMMAFLNKEFVYLVANNSYLNEFGKISDEIIGKTVSQVFGNQFFNEVVEPHAIRCLEGEEVNYQAWFDFTSTNKKYMDVHYYPYRDANNEIQGFVVSTHDITKREMAERDLKRSEQRLRAITESVIDAVITSDDKGNIIAWNNGAKNLFGYREYEAIGQPLTTIIPERYKKAHIEGISRVAAGGRPNVVGTTVELEGLRKDGSEFPLDMSLSTWREGEETFFTAILRDITKRKLRQQELEERNMELKVAIKQTESTQNLLLRTEKLASIGTLSAGVAHEILNPLNIIGTIVQVMNLEETTADTKENLDEIMNQIKRATKITNNLRMFAHQKKAEITEFDIHTLFDKTASLIEYDLNLDNIQIVRDYEDELPLVSADEDQMAQVFLNLLNNSRDAVKKQAESIITIKTRAIKGHVEIIFSDNGQGIPDEIIGKVFDPFFSTKAPGQGTGLGLSLVLKIIETLNGDIKVRNLDGSGAEFTVTLPIATGKLA